MPILDRRLKTWLKAAVSLALLAVLFMVVDWRAALRKILDIRLSMIPLLLAISVVLILLSCAKWWLFLRARGQRVSMWRLFGLYLVGYFFNNILPGSMGGDAVRGAMLGREIGSHSDSFGSVFLERYTGFMALIAAGLIAAAFNAGLAARVGLTPFLILMAALLAAMAAFLFVRPAQRIALACADAFPGAAVSRALRKFLDVVFFFRDKPGVLGLALFYALLYHLVAILNTYTVCLALGVPCGLLDLAVVVPLSLLVGSVPVTISNIGIQENAYVYFLGFASISKHDACAVALVLRAKIVIMALLGGLLLARWSWLRDEMKKQRETPGAGTE